MKIEAKDLAKEFGYKFSQNQLNLPQYKGDLAITIRTQANIEEVLPYVSLNNEIAKREILVSPVILDLVYYTKSQVRIEYQIKVNEQLQGYLDYLIRNNTNLLVIESVEENLDYGMTQLFAELIALNLWQENQDKTELIGAVTTGNIWQFARLNRQKNILNRV